MKKVIVIALVVAAAFYAKKHFMPGELSLSSVSGGNSQEAVAKERFEKFMRSWKNGGVSLNDAEQAAACLWARGKPFIADNEEIRNAADSFDKWRKAKSLYVQDISYTIGDYRQEGDHTIVDVTINGSRYHVGIPKDANPMFWAE